MPSTLPILRARRERRLVHQRASSVRMRGAFISAGMILSLLLGAFILITALTYADLTRDLPSIETLLPLLNPPDGLLLQPTRIYDRTGEHLLFTFAPDESPRRYIPLSEQNPQHLPQALADAVIAASDPQFWRHAGYTIAGLDNPDLHPSLAQRIVFDLLLYNEPPSLQRAIRERILAAQITAEFGRTQVLEWFLNSASFGRSAYGAEAAARLYFGKSATELTLFESAVLAAVIESPSLNPLDAPQVAIQRGRDMIQEMQVQGLITDDEAGGALAELSVLQPAPPPFGFAQGKPQVVSAFVNLVISQLDSRIPRERFERGGLTILSTLDYDLQTQASCITTMYAARLAGMSDLSKPCDALRFLPSFSTGVTLADSSASAIILDPQAGQVLAVVGETLRGQETPLFAAHRPGSSLDAFVYLTGFTRGLSPASLMWDIPSQNNVENYDGKYHGPVRLRVALANDYQVPVETVKQQTGVGNVTKTAESFGVSLDEPVGLLQLAGAYGAFGVQGIYFGQATGDAFGPVSVLRVETSDHAVWLDWTSPQTKPVVTPALAYLMNHVLSDETARWPSLGRPNSTQINRPAAVKLAQTPDSRDAWTIGYTPARVVAVWTGTRKGSVSTRMPAALWSALMQAASQSLPPDGWSVPQGVTTLNVCDPSGLLPTSDCPNIVSEVFLNGNEPAQADNLYRKFSVNKETGLLATVFTPPQVVEDKVYLVVPSDARKWAESAGLEIPPDSYDAIQASPFNPDVNITAPALFGEASGNMKIKGTAAGADFVSYRVLAGKGLNPQEWIQLGNDVITPVENGVLAEWDTTGLSGLYAIQLQVVRSDQKLDTAVIQVTVR